MRTLLVASAISGAVLFFLGAVVGYARAEYVLEQDHSRRLEAWRAYLRDSR